MTKFNLMTSSTTTINMAKCAKYKIAKLEKKVLRMKNIKLGKWLRLSWQSGCFWHQRSTVWILSLSNCFKRTLFSVNYIEKTKKEKKRSGMTRFQKEKIESEREKWYRAKFWTKSSESLFAKTAKFGGKTVTNQIGGKVAQKNCFWLN